MFLKFCEPCFTFRVMMLLFLQTREAKGCF